MKRALRIAVADDEADMRDYFRDILPDLGHEVVAVASTGRELVERCREVEPDLVISDVRMPDMDGLEAASRIARRRAVPFIIVSAYHDPELIERAEATMTLAYLIKPIQQPSLEAAIAIAMRRFMELEAMQREASDLRQALEDRKVIERAKGILMKRVGIDEEEAFRRLRRTAMDESRRLVEVARTIVRTETGS